MRIPARASYRESTCALLGTLAAIGPLDMAIVAPDHTGKRKGQHRAGQRKHMGLHPCPASCNSAIQAERLTARRGPGQGFTSSGSSTTISNTSTTISSPIAGRTITTTGWLTPCASHHPWLPGSGLLRMRWTRASWRWRCVCIPLRRPLRTFICLCLCVPMMGSLTPRVTQNTFLGQRYRHRKPSSSKSGFTNLSRKWQPRHTGITS